MSWEQARKFCGRTNSTLPIITDEDIDNVFQQFMSDSNNIDVNHDATEHNSVWLGAEAKSVDSSAPWHWINGKTSGQYSGKFVTLNFQLLLNLIFIAHYSQQNSAERDTAVSQWANGTQTDKTRTVVGYA